MSGWVHSCRTPGPWALSSLFRTCHEGDQWKCRCGMLWTLTDIADDGWLWASPGLPKQKDNK